MSPRRFEPIVFTWTAEEARVAASRAALRSALAGGLTARHLAPLTAFALALAFTAILALTGLVSRRHGEIALLLEAGAFMAYRLTTRRRFLAARRDSVAVVETMRASGEMVAQIDEEGVSLVGATAAARWNFTECLEVEDAGGMIYLWPRGGTPAFLPTRIFDGDDEARRFLTLARARAAKSATPIVSPPRPSRPTP